MHRLGLVCLAVLALACSKPADKPPAAPVKAVTVADTGATTNPPAELPMDVQHRTMDSVQGNYGVMLSASMAKDKAGTSRAAHNIASLADRIPGFMIHKAGVTPDSLQRWARMLKGQAMRVGQLADADSLDPAHEIAVNMNATCNTCHDMYRVEEAHHDHDEKPAPAAKKKSTAKK